MVRHGWLTTQRRRSHGCRRQTGSRLVPGTADVDLACQWLEDYADVNVGVEGLVIKGLSTTYRPGARGWQKYRFRDTAEAIVGAVVGTPKHPERLIVGRYNQIGELRIVGTTGELRRGQRLS